MTRNRVPRSFFGEITEEEFLAKYWGKKPLLVRNAWPDFVSPVGRDELVQLAGREDADSRLILEQGGEYPWEALFGPFEAEELQDLPGTHWTLLVQEVDRLVPDVGRLLDAVPFLPNWRFDDIMVSYAVDHGGVGAHIDQYDVFLLQGEGERVWQVQSRPVVDEVLLPDLDVRILADFVPSHEWTLTPGDMLYLPPRIAHKGVAVGMSVTYSIGCRLPSASELLDVYVSDWLESGSSDDSLAVDATSGDGAQGRVQSNVKAFVRDTLARALKDEASIDQWIGRYLSRPARGHAAVPPTKATNEERLLNILQAGGVIRTAVRSQVLFDGTRSGGLILYAGGDVYPVGAGLEAVLADLTGRKGLRYADHPELASEPDFVALLVTLVNAGYFRLETSP